MTDEKRYPCANPDCPHTVSEGRRETMGPLCAVCDLTYHEIHDGMVYRRVLVEVGPARDEDEP